MAKRVLFLHGHLGERSVGNGSRTRVSNSRRSAGVRNEHCVVSKASFASLRLRDVPLTHSLSPQLRTIGIRDERNGAESCCTLRDCNTLQFAQQLASIVCIGGIGTGESRGVHSGSATKCVNLQPRVVGNRRQAGCIANGASLQTRVAQQCVGVLDDVANRVRSWKKLHNTAKQILDFCNLVGIRRRTDELLHTRSAIRNGNVVTRAMLVARR
jgi:hypothetical protein